ncbi:hypothetical protein B4U79_19102, partial [Dinothrombium tinctorium]
MGIFFLVLECKMGVFLSLPVGAAVLETISGFTLFVMSVIGFKASRNESVRLLNYYQMTVGSLIFLQIPAVILFLVHMLIIRNAMMNYTKYPQNDPRIDAVDQLQWIIRCCGAEVGPSEWVIIDLKYARTTPESCCYRPASRIKNAKCILDEEPLPFQTPCIEAAWFTFRVIDATLTGVILGVIIVQLLATGNHLHAQIRNATSEYGKFAEDDPRRHAVDQMQYMMKCCGIDFGPEEWITIHVKFSDDLPRSCCSNFNDDGDIKCRLSGDPKPFDKPCAKNAVKMLRILAW